MVTRLVGQEMAASNLPIGPAVPTQGLVVYGLSDKMKCNQALIAHFGRGQWLGKYVKGVVGQKTGRTWAVAWDIPLQSGNTTDGKYSADWFTKNALLHDPGAAGQNHELQAAVAPTAT